MQLTTYSSYFLLSFEAAHDAIHSHESSEFNMQIRMTASITPNWVFAHIDHD